MSHFQAKKNMYLLGRLLTILFVITSCASNNNDKNLENFDLKYWEEPKIIVVANKEDTWEKLANKFKLGSSILKRNNKTKTLKEGVFIEIPKKILYEVHKGDSIILIALKHGMTFSEVVELNSISEPDKIKVGSKLKLVEINKIKEESFKKDKREKFQWPIKGQVIKTSNPNKEIKIKSVGNIRSANKGKVVYVGDEVGNYGNLIIIEHKNGFYTSYGNLSKVFVKKNDEVLRGQKIAYIDNQALSFSIRTSSANLNPLKYLP